MNTTPILAKSLGKLAAMTVTVAAPAMLFLGAGSATAHGGPGGGPDNPENSAAATAFSRTVGSIPSASHPDFDWRPIAPTAQPGTPRTTPVAASTQKIRLLPDILGCTECRPSVRPTEARSWDPEQPSDPDDPEGSVGTGR